MPKGAHRINKLRQERQKCPRDLVQRQEPKNVMCGPSTSRVQILFWTKSLVFKWERVQEQGITSEF